MLIKDKPLKYMTSDELETAIRRHREQTRKLLAEVRSRRAGPSAAGPEDPAVAPPGAATTKTNR